MIKSRLRALLEGDDEQIAVDRRGTSDYPRAPSLDERANLYLNAVHGAREFTNEEYAFARKTILGVMTANVRAGFEPSPSDPINFGGRNDLGVDQASAQQSSAVLSADTAFDSRFELSNHEAEVSFYREFWPKNDPAIVGLAARQQFLKVEDGSRVERRKSLHEAILDPVLKSQPKRKWSRRSLFLLSAGVSSVLSATLIAAVLPLLFPVLQNEASKPEIVARFLQGRKQAPSAPSLRSDQIQMSEVGQRYRQSGSELSERLFTLGNKLISSGDLYGGRIALSEAADEGSAPAALALGTSFDPNEISRQGKFGGSPDIDKARDWYLRAKKLGSSEVQALLDRLENNTR